MRYENEQTEFKVQMTDSIFKEVIAFANSYEDVFEEMRSLNQALTFKDAANTFGKYRIDFSEDKYSALGMKNPGDEHFTNLAMLCLTSAGIV